MDHCWYYHFLADEQFIMMCHEFVSVSFYATLPSLSKFVPPSSISHFLPSLRFLHSEFCSAWRCDIDISGTMRYMFCDFSDMSGVWCALVCSKLLVRQQATGSLLICWWDGNRMGTRLFCILWNCWVWEANLTIASASWNLSWVVWASSLRHIMAHLPNLMASPILHRKTYMWCVELP